MAQLALYLDQDTARRLDEAARREGISRSAWVRRVVQTKLGRPCRRFPDSFYEAIGSWEDDRPIGEIMRELREAAPDREREPLD